jgi:hypothetical protein
MKKLNSIPPVLKSLVILTVLFGLAQVRPRNNRQNWSSKMGWW